MSSVLGCGVGIGIGHFGVGEFAPQKTVEICSNLGENEVQVSLPNLHLQKEGDVENESGLLFICLRRMIVDDWRSYSGLDAFGWIV
jgi:hypothetical protein